MKWAILAVGLVGCGVPVAERSIDAGVAVDAGAQAQQDLDAGAGSVATPMFQFVCSSATYDGATYHWTARVEHDGGGDGNARIVFFVDGSRIATSDPFGVDPDSEILLPDRTIEGPPGSLTAGFEYQSLVAFGSSDWSDAGGPAEFGGGVCH